MSSECPYSEGDCEAIELPDKPLDLVIIVNKPSLVFNPILHRILRQFDLKSYKVLPAVLCERVGETIPIAAIRQCSRGLEPYLKYPTVFLGADAFKVKYDMTRKFGSYVGALSDDGNSIVSYSPDIIPATKYSAYAEIIEAHIKILLNRFEVPTVDEVLSDWTVLDVENTDSYLHVGLLGKENNTKFIGHNIIYDLLQVHKDDVEVHDTMLMFRDLYPFFPVAGLKVVSTYLLGTRWFVSDLDVLADLKEGIIPLKEKVKAYNEKDLQTTRQLANLLYPQTSQFYRNFVRVVPTLVRMCERGIQVNMEEVFKMKPVIVEENRVLQAESPVLLTSPKQICEYYNLTKSSFKYLPTTSEFDGLKKHRKNKAKLTTINNLIKYEEDNQVYPVLSIHSTATGRPACSHPNLLNVPLDCKYFFEAREGYKLLNLDVSQWELRVLAHYSQDPMLIKHLNQGKDLHAMTAKLLGCFRSEAKSLNFGIIYGISPFGLARNAGISMGEAHKLIREWYRMYPAVSKFHAKLRSSEFFKTLVGRTLYLKPKAIPQKLNYPIQSTASDLFLLKALPLGEEWAEAIEGFLLLTVYDNILFEIPESVSQGRIKDLQGHLQVALSKALDYRPKVFIDVQEGRTWDSENSD